MTKVTRKDNFDYVTVSVSFDKDTKLNMTASRRGKKVSAYGFTPAQMKAVLLAWDAISKKHSTVGQTMTELEARSSKATSPAHLIELLAL